MYLAEFAFVSVNSIFGQMLLFYEGFIVLVSHPDTNPAELQWTLLQSCQILRGHTCGEKKL